MANFIIGQRVKCRGYLTSTTTPNFRYEQIPESFEGVYMGSRFLATERKNKSLELHNGTKVNTVYADTMLQCAKVCFKPGCFRWVPIELVKGV